MADDGNPQLSLGDIVTNLHRRKADPLLPELARSVW